MENPYQVNKFNFRDNLLYKNNIDILNNSMTVYYPVRLTIGKYSHEITYRMNCERIDKENNDFF